MSISSLSFLLSHFLSLSHTHFLSLSLFLSLVRTGILLLPFSYLLSYLLDNYSSHAHTHKYLNRGFKDIQFYVYCDAEMASYRAELVKVILSTTHARQLGVSSGVKRENVKNVSECEHVVARALVAARKRYAALRKDLAFFGYDSKV